MFNEIENQNTLNFVRCFGCEAYKSDFEADKLLAFLSKNNPNSFVLSSDSDCLALGVPKLLRVFSHKKEGVELVVLHEILKKWEISMENFVEFCVLMGTDYNKNIKGVGPETLFDLIQNLKSNERIFEKFKSKKEMINEEQLVEIKNYFMDQSSGDFERFEEKKVENESDLNKFFDTEIKGIDLKTREWILRNLSDTLEIRNKNKELI